jgi:hypothetical protein
MFDIGFQRFDGNDHRQAQRTNFERGAPKSWSQYMNDASLGFIRGNRKANVWRLGDRKERDEYSDDLSCDHDLSRTHHSAGRVDRWHLRANVTLPCHMALTLNERITNYHGAVEQKAASA